MRYSTVGLFACLSDAICNYALPTHKKWQMCDERGRPCLFTYTSLFLWNGKTFHTISHSQPHLCDFYYNTTTVCMCICGNSSTWFHTLRNTSAPHSHNNICWKLKAAECNVGTAGGNRCLSQEDLHCDTDCVKDELYVTYLGSIFPVLYWFSSEWEYTKQSYKPAWVKESNHNVAHCLSQNKSLLQPQQSN